MDAVSVIKNNLDVNSSQQKQINSLLRDIAVNKREPKTDFNFSINESNSKNNPFDVTNYEYQQLKQMILENNKAIEYATNAFTNSSIKQQWYMDQYRQGLL